MGLATELENRYALILTTHPPKETMNKVPFSTAKCHNDHFASIILIVELGMKWGFNSH